MAKPGTEGIERATMNGLAIRDARKRDVPAMIAIYAPFVTDTPVSFEVEVPPTADFEERMTKAQSQWAWLVAELDGRVVGYAYGSQFRARAAYRFSAEVSAYVDATARGKGVASALYRRLFEILEAKGYCNLYAGIVIPNDASVGFHKALGFESIGTFHRAGWKFGAWHDVSWWERRLRDTPVGQPGSIAPR